MGTTIGRINAVLNPIVGFSILIHAQMSSRIVLAFNSWIKPHYDEYSSASLGILTHRAVLPIVHQHQVTILGGKG